MTRFPEQWRFVHIRENSKAPIGRSWQKSKYAYEELTPIGEKYKGSSVGGYGVLAGEASGGLLLLDHDGASCDQWMKDEGWPVLPLTQRFHGGRPGHYQMAYRVPKKWWDDIQFTKFSTGVRTKGPDGKDSVDQLELRWSTTAGIQSVVEGIHPGTKETYRWENTDIEIAEAPLWLIEKMVKPESEIKKPAPSNSFASLEANPGFNQKPSSKHDDIERAIEYLWSLPPETADDAAKWKYVGCSLRGVSNSERLRDEFEKWASTADPSKYKPGESAKMWDNYCTEHADPHGLAKLGAASKPYRVAKATERLKKSATAKKKAVGHEGDGESSEEQEPRSTHDYELIAEAICDLPMQMRIPAFLEMLECLSICIENSIERTVSILHFRDLCKLRTYMDSSAIKTQIRNFRYSLEELVVIGPEDETDEVEPVDWLIENMVQRKAINLVCGPPKISKTIMTFRMISNLLTGGEFMGRETKKQNVMLVCSDQPEAQTKDYLMRSDVFKHPNLRRLNDWRLTEKGIDDLLQTVEDTWEGAPFVLVIDSLRSSIRGLGIDENAAEAADMLYELKNRVAKANGTVILIHHSGKDPNRSGPDSVRGNSGIAGASDNIIVLYRTQKKVQGRWKDDLTSCERRLTISGRGPQEDLRVKVNPADLTWTCLGNEDDMEEKEVEQQAQVEIGPFQEEVLEYLIGTGAEMSAPALTKRLFPEHSEEIEMNPWNGKYTKRVKRAVKTLAKLKLVDEKKKESNGGNLYTVFKALVTSSPGKEISCKKAYSVGTSYTEGVSGIQEVGMLPTGERVVELAGTLPTNPPLPTHMGNGFQKNGSSHSNGFSDYKGVNPLNTPLPDNLDLDSAIPSDEKTAKSSVTLKDGFIDADCNIPAGSRAEVVKQGKQGYRVKVGSVEPNWWFSAKELTFGEVS